MLQWLFGGTVNANRSMTFYPWENDDPGLDGVRCVLKVTRGSTSHTSEIPWEEKIAEGTGLTMEEAFDKAYDSLVGWLV
jgi:hypothetical protein